MSERTEARDWARNEFGDAQLGHRARTERLVTMAAGAARGPAGKVSEVYASDAARQGAYDFLEGSSVTAGSVTASCVQAAVARCAEHSLVIVPVDGSSLTFTDRTGKKGLGALGSRKAGARGLKVMTAYAVDETGVPLGVTAQSWWTRPKSAGPRTNKRTRNAKRKTSEKETQHWLDVIGGTVDALKSTSTRAWFQLDREGDSAAVLGELAQSGHWFTVRSSANRRLVGPSPQYLRQHLAQQRIVGSYRLPVPSGPKRTKRVAQIVVRVAEVELRFRHPWTKKVTSLKLNAVWAREVDTTPRGEKSIDWLLFTNREVATFEDAYMVVCAYATRWRIEELHRTWKSTCRVEDAQLHGTEALIKWATILLAVATRIERLKQLARETPDVPATTELQPNEIRALVLLKGKQKKRTETVSDAPTIAQAVRWMADLGGYTGKSSGGPPGATTIGRGLHDVMVAAAALDALGEERRRK